METEFEVAKRKHNEANVDFDETLRWHLLYGFVVSIPYVFATGYFYKDGERTVVYISYMGGDMKLFLKYANFEIDFIEFQRNFNGKTKRYDYKRFVEKI